MAQGTIPDDLIFWAIDTLISVADDDIQRHSDKFQQLVTRVTQVTTSPSESAETILATARANLNTLMEFFREDHTKTILQFRYPAGSDPRIAVLSVRSNKKCLCNLFLRLLACRYLALGHRQLESGDGSSQKRPRPKRVGKGRLLLRNKGITTNNQTEDGLKRGKKALTIEDSLGVPEVSLVLLHSLSRFNHLYAREARRLVEIFSNYPELGDACRSLNERKLLSDYQSLYNHHVDTLLLASQEGSGVISGNGSEPSH
ncbi:hypothetical protein CNMCM5793_007721 [Aspergillus hiratsukae]|uniref:Uncharacterized protein n=1 Tax=Aspergillus hiratsukae TaxID=1194566 RepID=A0A8H6U9S4_9EURO|nr:hypothetical protein CNMCM5793_007721 [Aspergillus hiratsukae]KAF7159033.1 hypothetical protein CNMCM6106_006126 [Aspergillus hiratsukae]